MKQSATVETFRNIVYTRFASFELELQTLKKLKGKQEESKKREMSRLMNKLDAQDKAMPAMKSATEPVAILDDSINPEDTVR